MTVTLQTILQKVLVLTLLPLLTIDSETHKSIDSTNNYSIDMTTLTIDFQDGFDDDAIVCKINDVTAFNKNHVKTAKLTGLADSVKLEIEKGKTNLEIAVKNKNMSKSIELDINEELYIGISIVNDSITHILSTQPFGYG
jgi:hypothetical protein